MQDIMVLRVKIPDQYKIKGEYTIGVLNTRHILTRLIILKDYFH